MNFRQYKKNAVGTTTLIFLLSACGGEKENLPITLSYGEWDNTISITDKIESAYNEAIDSVIISAGTVLLANQDKLFIEDYNSTEKILHVINIPERQYIGAFGDFGEGPSEIIRPGSIFSLGTERLAVFDYGHWSVKTFDVESALSSPNYDPQTLVSLSEDEVTLGFPDRFVFVHDDWGIGRLIMPKENGGYSQALCSFNVKTGAINPFGEQSNPKGFRSSVAASYNDSVIVEVSSTQDVIRIYDLKGNVTRTIHGPLYDTKPSRELAFYSKAVIGDGRIYAVYSGEDKFHNFCGKKIIILSLTGEYIGSYQLDNHITDMAYSREYNRLYMSFDSDRQFGYLQIGDKSVRNDKNLQRPDSINGEDNVVKTSKGVKSILTLIDPDNQLKMTPVSEAQYKWYKSSESESLTYYISVFNQTHTDTIAIDSITSSIPCQIHRSIMGPIIPRLMFSVSLIPDVNILPLKNRNVKLTVYYNGNEQNLTVKLLNEPHNNSPIKSL